MARGLEWNQGVARFIMVNDTDKQGIVTRRFINVNHIQQIYQQDSDVIIELSNYYDIRIADQNLDVFMDRFI